MSTKLIKIVVVVVEVFKPKPSLYLKMFPYKLAAEGRDKRCIYKLQAYSAYGTVVYKMLQQTHLL